MRILIDIGHPGHVHLFKHFAREMQNKGHEIFFTCREKEFEVHLLETYGFKYRSFGKKYKSKPGKLWGMVEFDVKEFLSGLKFKPDILLSHGSIYAAHAAFLLRKPHIALEDTGNIEQVKLYEPFTKHILTSDFFPINYGEKQIRYPGYHELAYLHPNRYKPAANSTDMDILKKNGKNVLLRFVAWNATHDFKHNGLSVAEKIQLVQFLEDKNYNVLISSEMGVPNELKKYTLKMAPDKIHHVLNTVDLFIGEGTTMAMEAGILGTPSIYINPLQYSNTDNLAEYGLVFNYSSFAGIKEKIHEIENLKNIKSDFDKRRKQMLKDKIDVTSFLVWFIENYPQSIKLSKNADKDFWQQFK
jgi:predicted glycosyltransferase